MPSKKFKQVSRKDAYGAELTKIGDFHCSLPVGCRVCYTPDDIPCGIEVCSFPGKELYTLSFSSYYKGQPFVEFKMKFVVQPRGSDLSYTGEGECKKNGEIFCKVSIPKLDLEKFTDRHGFLRLQLWYCRR